MPHSKITFIVSRFTASGLYLRTLRRDRIVSIIASELLFSVTVASLSFCTCGPQADSINRLAPNSITFTLFILCCLLNCFFANLTKKAASENESRLKIYNLVLLEFRTSSNQSLTGFVTCELSEVLLEASSQILRFLIPLSRISIGIARI